ncbi:AtpZ/AtpI family protein [Ferruginibacter yonginensis]|uniref:AtpZ/AtpI family protein n=1 Tax=Ferruginibacter yonginensis TaxID=1310416 RepID=A0ABV8QUM0_9BACT
MPIKNNNQLLWQYAGFATQLILTLGLAIYGGMKLDKWLQLTTPIATWVLPLLVIIIFIYKAIKDTATKNKK